MPTAPPRSPLAMLAAVFASFCGGPLLGAVAAHWSAPGSALAQTVSPLAFALAFAGGLLLWFGVGAVALVGGALLRLLHGRWRRRAEPARAEVFVPPGYGAFLPLALGLGLLAGGVAGIVPEAASFWAACAVHLAAGAAYGLALRALARRGYLPFPEPA